MSALNWRRVEEIYNVASERDPAERSAFLDAACAGQPPEVRAQVETLLQTTPEEGGRFLEEFLVGAMELAEEGRFLPEGTRLLERYTIGEVLGVGGMGVVYKARDEELGRVVAIKLISAEMAVAGGSEALERFRAEANAMALLKDPRFIRIYDTGGWGQQPFLVMELVEGTSLESRPEARMSPREAARLIASLAGAMSHAHALGIVHRDLTPSNILLEGNDRQPKIADLGLAINLQSAMKANPGAVEGKPSYMAPEQAAGRAEDIGPCTDVYALGAVLYELLTGRPPFQADTLTDTLLQVLEKEPVPPRALNRRIDRDLQAVCLKCLHKVPAQRYAAGGLAQDLNLWLDGRETRARRWGFAERVLRACGRYPAAAASTAAAVVLLLVVAVTVASAVQERGGRIEAAHRSNSYAAYGIASNVLRQLEDWSNPLVSEARDPQLRELLKASDRDDRQKRLADLHARLTDLRQRAVRPGEGSPFEDCFLVDQEGTLLGISPSLPLLGKSYGGRDYFQGARRNAEDGWTGRDSVHISRVFRPEKDAGDTDSSEFAIAVAVRDGDGRTAEVLGVLVASLTTDSKLGLVSLRLSGKRHRALLIGRGDTNRPRPEAAPGAREGFYVLVHPGFGHGNPARPVHPPWTGDASRRRAEPEFHLQDLDAFDPGTIRDADYRDPFDNERQLAGFAQVGNTELVVMVQEPYDQAVESHLGWAVTLLAWFGGLAATGLLLAASFRLVRAWVS